MSLCNNAYATIAYSLGDVLDSIEYNALGSKLDYGDEITTKGGFLMNLLLSSFPSLAKVNSLYAIK